jgi:hypothetical protein
LIGLYRDSTVVFILGSLLYDIFHLLKNLAGDSDAAAKSEAERQAKLLLALAPVLDDLVTDEYPSRFMQHFQDSYQELAPAALRGSPPARVSNSA